MMPSSKRPSNSNTKRADKKLRKVKGTYNENTLFSMLLCDCGVTLMDGSKANTIAIEQSQFLKKFHSSIVTHEDYPSVITEIFDGVVKYMENDERFLRMMLTTDLVENLENEDLLSVPQDSVARLLLKTPPLQTTVAKTLIGRMRQFERNPTRNLPNNAENPIHVPQLILNQLRWLDTMEDADTIALKLIDAASQMNDQLACSIITSLPEVIGDEVHDNVIDRLKEFLDANHCVAIPLLSTIGSLNCSPKAFSNFENTVFLLLNSQRMDEFPFIAKFLLQSVNADNAERNIARMRPHISFSVSNYSQDSIPEEDDKDVSTLTHLAETILHAAQYRSIVADSWIKVLKNLKTNDFTGSDFITAVLLSATYNTNLKKSAISLLKAKVMEGVIVNQLVQAAFLDCSGVLNHYFSTISDLASLFLSSNSSPVRHFGSYLYVCMFMYLNPSFQKDVIKLIVQHVSTFSESEVDSALKALREIVSEKVNLVAPYAACLKDMMDHMERLSASQMRQIFEILNKVACSDGSVPSSELEEQLSATIWKYLTHPLTKFKCIGVIGAVSTMRVLGHKEIYNDENGSKVKLTLNFLQEIVDYDNRIGSYYFDELCNVQFDSLHQSLRNIVHSVALKTITENFLIKHDDKNPSWKSAFGSQTDVESAISIYHSVQSCDSSHFVICPIFKALFKVTAKYQQEEAFVFTQMPVQFHRSVFEIKDFELQTPTEQKFALDTMFIAVNLFREHINFLCSKKSSYRHLLSRVNAIVEIENIIESLLSSFSQKYNPPLMITEFANFSNADGTNLSNVTQTQSGTSPMKSPKENASILKKSKAVKKKTDSGYSVQSLKPQYFRELAPAVITVLETPMSEDLFEEDIDVANSSDDVTLTAGQALFILMDLKRKIVHKLPARTEEKRFPFASSTSPQGFDELDKVLESDFGDLVCNLIPSLCNHLESVSGAYEENRHEHLDSRNRHTLMQCYENVLEVMRCTLSWRGLKSNPLLLKGTLFSIVRRFSPTLCEDSSMRNLNRACIGYLKNFQNTLAESSLQAAVLMMKLLHVVTGFGNEEESRELMSQLHDFSADMLKIDWDSCLDQSCPTAKKNEHISCLLKMNIHTSDDITKCAFHFVDEGLCKLGSDDIMYPYFQKNNSHILYGSLLEIMADETYKIPSINARDDESTTIEILLKWNDCMKLIGVIVKLLREYHSRMNVLSSLKHGKTIIENFIKNGMPICEKLFHLYQDDIVSTLKHLQSSTRQLQHLTCHSKVTQDVMLAKHVPPLKKSLESLLFRVKAMLALHNCQEAFWLGNLKNRNIQGEEILSQLTQQRSSQDVNTTCDYQEMSYSESY